MRQPLFYIEKTKNINNNNFFIFFKKPIDKCKGWCYNTINKKKTFEQKERKEKCFQRIGGWCEP